MGLSQLNFKGKDKVETAIALLQAYNNSDDPYYLAFSGGKDSVVIYDLTVRAGVAFDSHYCVSPIDPKEIHDFIREYYPNVQWAYHARGFWKLVHKNGLPLRQSRWCCRYIKEAGGKGRVKIVGNRRFEGANRSKQRCFEPHRKHNNTYFIRPILNWTTEEVWEYIRTNNLSYCSLYDEGAQRKGYGEGSFKRLGCVLCPFTRNSAQQIERFPKIVKLWRLSCDHIMERRLAKGNATFKDGEELWEWWISRK